MIEPWLKRRIGVAAVEVASNHTANEASTYHNKDQTKHDAFHLPRSRMSKSVPLCLKLVHAAPVRIAAHDNLRTKMSARLRRLFNRFDLSAVPDHEGHCGIRRMIDRSNGRSDAKSFACARDIPSDDPAG